MRQTVPHKCQVVLAGLALASSTAAARLCDCALPAAYAERCW
jgi:hypothetical protein